MNPLVIRIILFVVVILGSGAYVLNLNSNIEAKDAKILSLQIDIDKQNTSIEKSGTERNHLESILKKTAIINKQLTKDLDKAKEDIMNRPDAKNCEEAIGFLSETAKNISEEWNKK